LTVAARAAIPGTYALLVGFNVRSLNPTGAWEPMTAQGKVTIGIPGLSDALQFLGIPSLLLLPGALVILTFLTMLPWLTGLPQVDWKKPALLLLAVLLSFAAAYLYPWVTGRWLGLARDYLRGYELRDVVYVWAGSMVVGVVAALVVISIYWICVIIRWLVERNEPRADDQPIDILKKLDYRHMDFELRPTRPANNNQAPWRLRLPFGHAGGREWLVQQGLIRYTNAAGGPERGAAIQRRLEAIDAAAQGAAKVGANAMLINEIEVGLSMNQLTVLWDPPNEGPMEVNANEYVDAAGEPARRMVSYQP
jgi:hypothetical protein